MEDKRPAIIAAMAGLGGAAVVTYALIAKKSTSTTPPVPLQQAPPLVPEFLVAPTSTGPTDNLPNKMPLTQNPLVTVLVPAGSDVDIYHIDIPRSYAAIITDIGNNMYAGQFDANGNQLFYYDFTIDGDLVERVKRIIANINNPLILPQQYLATDNINWRCHNGTQQDLLAEVYCNGYMQRRMDG